jgi:hypothetical protein
MIGKRASAGDERVRTFNLGVGDNNIEGANFVAAEGGGK